MDFYRDDDFVNPRIDEQRKMVEIPRPAGVILALTPSTNPIATINYKVLISLMTRNAIVISPHPAARECSVEAGRILSAAATEAGAPDGVIQIIEDPGIPLVEQLMGSPKTSVILATGGTAMVRSAYSSSNPAIGVGPGNAPAFVDSSADVDKAAKRIVESKSFDNSALCTNESVLIALEEIDARLRQSLKQAKAYVCNEDDVDRLRRYLFHDGGFNIECIGRDAVWIAQECGIRVPEGTLVLLAPITQIGVEEPLSREKALPRARISRGQAAQSGDHPVPRRASAGGRRSFRRSTRQGRAGGDGICLRGRGLSGRGKRPLHAGSRGLSDRACSDVYHWHRLLRPQFRG